MMLILNAENIWKLFFLLEFCWTDVKTPCWRIRIIKQPCPYYLLLFDLSVTGMYTNMPSHTLLHLFFCYLSYTFFLIAFSNKQIDIRFTSRDIANTIFSWNPRHNTWTLNYRFIFFIVYFFFPFVTYWYIYR
jgi:hypothetical protein